MNNQIDKNYIEILMEVNVTTASLMPYIKDIGKCFIEVFSDEGNNIPHFHIRNEAEVNNGSEKDRFHTCLYIFDNRYFTHKGKMDTFKKKQMEELNDWLKKPNKRYGKITNWEAIRKIWIDLYDNGKYANYSGTQPDYTTIKPYKG